MTSAAGLRRFENMPSNRTRLSARTLLPLFLASGFAVLLLIVPMPGSLSVVGTRWLSAAGARVPGMELISEAGLAVLALTTAVVLVRTWLRRPDLRFRTGTAAVGVVLAYAASEGLKIIFAQERPCAAWSIATECPPPGDWSLPSNHATLAFGAVAVIALAAGRSWLTWAAIALAGVVALARVAQGVHYVHDVAFGAVLGVAIPLLLVIAGEAIRRGAQRSTALPR